MSEKKQADVKVIVAAIEKQWKKIYPDEPFNYSFLNEAITWLYGQEQNTSWLINAAMIITIFISCMGLFGLGMFTAQKRTKEIGIRKILGASIADITMMLSKDFVKLVFNGIGHCKPDSVVLCEPVAAGFCLPHKHQCMDFYYCRAYGDSHSNTYGKFSGF